VGGAVGHSSRWSWWRSCACTRFGGGVCSRGHVAQYQRWHALEEKEPWAKAWSRLRIATFATARTARHAHVDKGTVRRAALAANARAVANVASASLAIEHAVSVVGVQAAGAAVVRI
jgi:hypothetical protein